MQLRVFVVINECLIAFACGLSFIQGQNDDHGGHAIDLLEESKKDEIRLMAIYSSKYTALTSSTETKNQPERIVLRVSGWLTHFIKIISII